MKTNLMYSFVMFLLLIFSNLVYSQVKKIEEKCPQGMISYWKFDELGSVTTFIDSYNGNNANCTNTTSPEEDSGIVNTSRKFDSNSVVFIQNYEPYNWGANSSFALEVWVKTTKPGTGNKVFIGRPSDDQSQTSWWLGYGDNNKAIFSVRDSGGIKTQIEGVRTINDGKWHLIVGVKNDSAKLLELYVDGIEENRQTTFFTGDFFSKSFVYLGVYVSGFHFIGSLDEAAIYGLNLSQNLISQHFSAGKKGNGYCDQFTTGIEETVNLPNHFILDQNYPNPFNPNTTINYSIPKAAFINLKVYDILGNEIRVLVNKMENPGNYSVNFNSNELPSGIYFYSLNANNFNQIRKMILIK